jgi:hypothetical protein
MKCLGIKPPFLNVEPRSTVLLGRGKVVPVLTVKTYKGSRGMAALILNLGTGWR